MVFVLPKPQLVDQKLINNSGQEKTRTNREKTHSKTCQRIPKGSQNDPKTSKNRSKNRLKKRSCFRTVLRPSWCDLGAILASSWGRFW